MIGQEQNESLGDIYRRLIATAGPISVAYYMGEANTRYYNSRDPLGAAGDFVTAPEISQMFGELIGLWLVDMWIKAGCPRGVNYVELGPGRGTLAQDVLNTIRRHGFEPAIHFIDTSPILRGVQAATHPTANWHLDLTTVPQQGPLLVVANEFLDALPVRQLVMTREGWRERMVVPEGDRFVCIAGNHPMDFVIPEPRRVAAVRTIYETCPAAASVLYELSGRLVQQGGTALFIDYGYTASSDGSTLQAVRDHRKVDPFSDPGEADLSAHVDFASLAKIAQARGCQWLGTVPQGRWLLDLGIDPRAQTLCAHAPDRAAAILSARDRLVHDDQMGQLFKVMGLAAPSWPGGEGF